MSFLNKIKCLRTDLGRLSRESQIVTLKAIEGEHKTRIFNKGTDESGQLYGQPPVAAKTIGVYGVSHGRKRQKKGRQVSKKDLVFNGDLIRNIAVGTTDQKVPAYGFLTDKSKDIAEGQEDQTKKDIFNLSGFEVQVAKTVFARTFKRQMKKCLQSN